MKLFYLLIAFCHILAMLLSLGTTGKFTFTSTMNLLGIVIWFIYFWLQLEKENNYFKKQTTWQ